VNVLILSPHTDDAELGCGASMAKMVEEGAQILWIVFSIAEDSLPESLPKDTLGNEFMNSLKCLGLDESNAIVHKFRVRKLLERRQDILEELVRVRREFAPDLVLTPSLCDVHQDHQAVSNEAVRAFKMHASIIGYELPWNHLNFNGSMFVRLEEKHLQRKQEMLQCYKSQYEKARNYFSQDFVRGLARVRGTQCNCQLAEAFEVIRWMV
jgi:LmbE family N-acetylglucosaminyl deacetylase